MKLIIDIDKLAYKTAMNGVFCMKDWHKAIENGTPIPDNATNGDVVKATTNFIGVQDEEDTIKISTSWWNSPYQKGGKE